MKRGGISAKTIFDRINSQRNKTPSCEGVLCGRIRKSTSKKLLFKSLLLHSYWRQGGNFQIGSSCWGLNLFLELRPGMHCQRKSNNAVGNKNSEVLTNLSVVEQLFACFRGYNKQCMEENDTDDGLFVGGFLHRCASNQ